MSQSVAVALAMELQKQGYPEASASPETQSQWGVETSSGCFVVAETDWEAAGRKVLDAILHEAQNR